ncbi:MAG: hypothetical protein CW338_07325, partial [Clostridiales bacterium]|nr:hypothetical protein [Clostridiales bacterium]
MARRYKDKTQKTEKARPVAEPRRRNDTGTETKPKKGLSSVVRRICSIAVISVLTLIAASMLLSEVLGYGFLGLPRKIIRSVLSPTETVFSTVKDAVSEYLRTLKLRGNIEDEYKRLLEINEELRNENAVLHDYESRSTELEDLLDLKNDFREMEPLAATVIGHNTGSYFSVLTLNVGSADGVRDFMAVVADGGLVGYTYDVGVNSCSVRCIIDSSATVAGMLKTSRDQGSVSGTLSIDGTAMCRMYYLPDTSLPRPGEYVITSGVGMEFPQGIPIGVVRESTRGLDGTKSYVVLEPLVDFQHLEYVLVLLYQPSYAEEAQNRVSSSQATLVPMATAWPLPTFQVGAGTGFSTPSPTPSGLTPTPSP